MREYFPCAGDEFGYAACKANQCSVHSGEPCYAECLVVAGDERNIRAVLAELANVMLVDSSNACSDLDALYVRDLLAHLDEGLDGVECLAGRRVKVSKQLTISKLRAFSEV